MKLHKLNCPNCNGELKMEISDKTKNVFCPYCGQQFMIDDEKKEYTINKNINVNKTVTVNKNIHNRYTDDAEILKEIYKDKKDRRNNMVVLFCILFLFAISGLCFLIPSLIEKMSENDGKISAGFYRDLVGEDYKTVEAHFEAAGFTNVELIDLDDAGLAVWKNGEVETISVGGNTSFDSLDFFEPDTKVIISYH